MSWQQTHWRRASVVRVFEVDQHMVVLSPDDRGVELSGDTAALARAVLSFLRAGHTGAEIVEHIEALTGWPVQHPETIGALLRQLAQVGAVTGPGLGREPTPAKIGPARVVLGLTGAVATMHAPRLVQTLLEQGLQVRVVATDDALRFVRSEALESLTHHRVVAGMWPEQGTVRVPHIELAQWADAVLVCPASATTISRLATGDHASIVSAVALSTTAPVLVVPSMNAAMYDSASVQRNLEQLTADGLAVAHPASGPEVAQRPHERSPIYGAAPPPSVVVQLLIAMLKRHAASSQGVPRDARGWDALYRLVGPSSLGWHRDEIDSDLQETIAAHAPEPTDVLDIGTGLGTVAIACGRAGHRVVATDVSAAALEQARRRPGAESVVWLRDDIADSRLHGQFGLAIDRGCLPLLDDAGARGYAKTLCRLIRPGGIVVLKILTGEDATARHAHPYTAEQVQARLGPDWAVLDDADSTLPGPTERPRARLLVLRRQV